MSKKSPMVRLRQDQIDKKLGFISDYVQAKNAATGAVLDQNANVAQKNIATLHSELHKDINIQINRSLMHGKIKEMYGEALADEYIRQLEAHEMYCHDESNCYPYCVSITMYPFLRNGMRDLGGESSAPKHLASYCGSFVNLIFAVSSQFAGAVAAVEFLMHFDYFARKDYGANYLTTHKKKITSALQHVMYSLNQPAAARNYQAPFFNLSVFDEPYFNSIFDGFVYPGTDDRPCYESIARLQEFFLSWFNEERKRSLLTFPVVTAATLCDGDKPVDKSFARMLSTQLAEGNSFFIYQSNSADSLASCCFDGRQPVLVKDSVNGVGVYEIGHYIDYMAPPDYVEVLHKGEWRKAQAVKIARGNRRVYKLTLEGARVIYATHDHLFPVLGVAGPRDVSVNDLVTGEYLRLDNGGVCQLLLKTALVKQPDYVYCFEVMDGAPYFVLANGIVTHNCRVRNEFQSKPEFSYTLGAGGVATGSVNVMTLNLNRLIQDGRDLKTEIEKLHKYQLAYRAIMKDFLDNKMLPVYDAGFVYMEKQYSTIGIMGIVEAAEYLGITPGNNKTYVDWVASQLKIIYDANREATKMFGVPFNTEMVPGESLGVKFASWDRADGYVVNRDCYNSYFYKVEDPNTDVFDKFQLHGEEIVKYLDGGSALHLNLDRSLTPDQYYNLMCLAAKVGCNYWTINVKATCCEDCGAIDKETTDVCSKCGSTNVVYATRVIGYLKKVSCFAEDRQREHAKRVYHRENR